MTRLELQTRLIARQSLFAALLGITAIGGYSLFHPAGDASDVSRRVLCHRLEQIESAEFLTVWMSDGSGDKELILVQRGSTETDDAHTCCDSQLPESGRIVARSAVLRLPGVAHDCRIPNPDHLIVLPGTPPPVFS